EVAIVYGLTVALSAALVWSEGASDFLRKNVHALVGVVFVAVPFWVLQRRDESFGRFGVAFGGVLDRPETPGAGVVGFVVDLARALGRALRPFVRETAFALGVALIVFPPYAIGFPIVGPRFLGPLAYSFRWPAAAGGADVWNLAAGNLLVVAVPEEFLYRGYLQTRL